MPRFKLVTGRPRQRRFARPATVYHIPRSHIAKGVYSIVATDTDELLYCVAYWEGTGTKLDTFDHACAVSCLAKYVQENDIIPDKTLADLLATGGHDPSHGGGCGEEDLER